MFRGDGVAKGYWRKPRETAEAFTEDGWLHTGDAGYLDEEGFLHFVDRYKDLIIASGYNIAPSEVEGVILQHPAVKEAAVIGVPDEYRGETVKAFVSLKDGYKGKVTAEEIIAHCRENLATFKVPRQITFLEEIPKNAVGKILRRQLREMNDQ
jgi:long-chain acyl-CoA synthetase